MATKSRGRSLSASFNGTKMLVGISILAAIMLCAWLVIRVYAKQKQSYVVPITPQVQTCSPRVIREREVVYKDMPPPQYDKRGPYQNDANSYKQIGMLVSKDLGEQPPVMLPLFGRKMVGRDRYEYYTATDKIHLWKVSVEYEHRDCQDQLGCQQIYDGVDVVVPDYSNKTFRASIYKNVNLHDRIDV